MAVKLHPSIDKGLKPGAKKFKGGTLTCHCAADPVTVTIKGNVAHNHACGCTKCWKPAGAKFSVVAVVSRDNLSVTSNEQKLTTSSTPAPPSSATPAAAAACTCTDASRTTNHPFFGLDFVHVELSKEKGWAKPEFAAFVSSIIEAGAAKPKEMTKIRDRLKKLRLTPYDCLSPPLMDAIATHVAKAERHAQDLTQTEIGTTRNDFPARLPRRRAGLLPAPLAGQQLRHALRGVRAAAGGGGPVPVLYYLAGLTCTEETFVTKAGALEHAARHGIMLVAPDTSPRVELPGDRESWDFGIAAGFYLDATQAPWASHYRMYSYVVDELPNIIAANFKADITAQRHHGPLHGRPWRADHRAEESAEVQIAVGVRAHRRADPKSRGE